MQGYSVVLDRDAIASHRARLAQRLATHLKQVRQKQIVLCCILKGAAYFAIDLSRDLQDVGIDHSMYFVGASSYGNGTQQRDRVDLTLKLVPEKFANRHIVLLDELYDSGKTLHVVKQTFVDALKLDAKRDMTTCVMFSKQRTHNDTNATDAKYDAPDFVGANVSDVWLVGYGLDDASERRGIRDLLAKTQSALQF